MHAHVGINDFEPDILEGRIVRVWEGKRSGMLEAEMVKGGGFCSHLCAGLCRKQGMGCSTKSIGFEEDNPLSCKPNARE